MYLQFPSLFVPSKVAIGYAKTTNALKNSEQLSRGKHVLNVYKSFLLLR